MLAQYIYLLKEREFIKTDEPIYKIRKTKQENTKRMLQYPKNSVLLCLEICSNCDVLEPILINLFKEKYKHRVDIGDEYFEGDFKLMIDDIHHKVKIDPKYKEIKKVLIKPKRKISKNILSNEIESLEKVCKTINENLEKYDKHNNVPYVIYDELYNSFLMKIKETKTKYSQKKFTGLMDHLGFPRFFRIKKMQKLYQIFYLLIKTTK